jgi:hypothetical protein
LLTYNHRILTYSLPIFNYFVEVGKAYGFELMASIYKSKIDRSTDFYDTLHIFDEWFIKLIRNCQASGIIQNKTNASDLVSLGIQIAIAREYEWCRTKGSSPLHETLRHDMEILCDVSTEYSA